MIILLSIVITILLYLSTRYFYKKNSKIYLSPLVITPILIVALLFMAKIPYDTYNSGGQWLSAMLQPATIALAVPLYKYRGILKKYGVEIISSVLVGSMTAILSSALLGEGMSVDVQLIGSLIPRSVTTPIAMDISHMIGGVPSVTAVCVIITGLLGSVLGPLVIRFFKIESEVARGVLLGTGAHAMGTSKAFELTSTTGTVSSISMILAAIITICMAPLIVPLLHLS